MFEIIVTDLCEAEAYIASAWPTYIISVLMEPVAIAGDHHLHVKFDDVNRINKIHAHPTPEHLRQILEFTANLTDQDRVLVHCVAGISRSTAIAIGILIQHGMSFQDAYHHIATIRPVLYPNKLIISYIDDHFNLNGELVALVQN